MKKVLLALLLAFSFTGVAKAGELSGTVSFASNYIYRGMSYYSQGTTYQAQGSPVIQGTLDWYHKGFGLTYFTSPVDTYDFQNGVVEKDIENDLFAYYVHTWGDFSAGLGVNYFAQMKNGSNDALEYNVNLTYKALRIDSSYTEVYFGADTNQSYTRAQFTPQLNSSESKTSLNLVTQLGYVYYNDVMEAGSSNSYDYKAGLSYSVDSWKTEIAYSNTIDRSNPYTGDDIDTDASVTIVVSKTFSILAD
jgi:uncharacterized protein (TIGR02001 family)